MPQLPPLFLEWLMHYGEFAIFGLLALGIIGLPIPDETLMAFAGYLVAQGKLPLITTLLAVFGGAICGITISYGLGRTAGSFLIKKYGYLIGITPTKIQRVHQWFERTGKWALFFGYFVLGVRHLTGYVAGASELEFRQFALFAYSGALVWTSLFLSLGYFFMNNWEMIVRVINHYVWFGVGILIAILLMYVSWRFLKKFR